MFQSVTYPSLRSRMLGLMLAVLMPVALNAQVSDAPAASTDGGDQVSAAAAENSGLWFVELNNPPVADGGSFASSKAEKDAFRKSAKAAGIRFTERFAFDTLFNGLSIRVNDSDIAKLSRLSNIKAIYPVETIRLNQEEMTPAEGPDLYTAINMTGANIAQSSLGLTGTGVKVAVMDTGIDYNHPDLGNGFGPGHRVAGGWDFVGDAYNADPTSASYNPNPVPDPDPDDCAGHGTHVAGIIGANGVVKGVAPGVTFLAYRVFGCQGSTDSDVMIAAMERALADGAQVLNMSIGSSFQWPEYPTAAAATRLVNKGVVVVASIGNSGTDGLYAAGAPGVGKKVIGVASIENTHVRIPYFTVSADSTQIGYTQATGSPAAPLSGTFPMARTGSVTSTSDACTALPPGSLAGKVALIRRGTCGFYNKAFNAQSAGAIAVVLYNNAPGRVNPTVAGSPAITIPVVAISDTEGALINSRLAAAAVTMTWTNQLGSFPQASSVANLISSFSSYGLTAELTFKPDLSAPGGQIFSTYPLELGGYATLSGTSMASPHTAGAVALLLEAKPKTSSQSVAAILQNSAAPRPWWGNPTLGFLDNVHRQGAGLIQIDKAILATTRIEPSELALGESQAGPAMRTLTITNSGSSDVTYDLSHTGALATGPNTFTQSFFAAFANAAFSVAGAPTSSITVPAGGSANVDVTLTAPDSLQERSLYGGYLVFTPRGGGNALRVPYAGMKGDYQTIKILTPTTNGFPWLAKLSGGLFGKQVDGAAFTMNAGDIPYVLVHFDHQVRKMTLEVVEVGSGKSWHTAFHETYIGRNTSATGFFALSWDGATTAGNKTYTVPNGRYVLRMTIEKPLSDGAPNDFETWTSPEFSIVRP